MPARTGCCALTCCICTVKDRDLADPDGTNVIELWTDAGVQDITETTTQNSDEGSPITCAATVTTPKPPCREITIVNTQLRTNVIERRFGILITVTPGSSGIFWSGAYNCNLGTGAYGGANAAGANCGITSDGSKVQVHFSAGFGTLEGALYEGPVTGGGGIPLNITQTPITVSLVSQGDPSLTWPASFTLSGAMAVRGGPSHGIRWWRLYPELLTFAPDGSSPTISLCYDTCNVPGGYITSETDALPPDPTAGDGGTRLFTIVMKQGDDLAISYPPVGTINTDDPSGWRHSVVPAQAINAMGWIDFGGDPWINDQRTFHPDFSPGAEPIIFGIGIQANASGSIRDYKIIRRLDNVCIRLKPGS